MKKLSSIFVIVIITIGVANATIWRVNNTPGVDADFTSFNDAQNASYVYPGDTIYLEPGAGTYGNITLTKKLIIIGNGYFLAENPETQANQNYSKLDVLTFATGSQGSIIQGCKIYQIKIKTSEIIIQRNYISYNSNYGTIFFDADNISNIIIRNNYLRNTHDYNSYIVYCNKSGVNNVIIKNNYFGMITLSTNCFAIKVYSGFSGTIENNVIYGNVVINNSNFNNNILTDGTFTQNNCIYTHNIGNSTQFGTGYNNQENVNMYTVFVGATGNSTDGQWQLKPGSPAIGAGTNGIDCGMFGGTFPYVLSGLPAVPAIYEHTQTIDYQNQQIDVNISVKSHN